MKLFYSPGACSLAPHIALEEAGADFEPVLVSLADKQNRSPEFLALNPQGRVPVIVAHGKVLTELHAILLYIYRLYPEANLMPGDPWKFAQASSLMAFLSNNVHIGFAGIWRPERFTGNTSDYPGLEQKAKLNLVEQFDMIESRLPDQGWVGGDHFSLADIDLLPFYRFGWRVGLPMPQFSRYTRIVDQASQRPAVVRVLQREGVQSLLVPAKIQ
jgi:glutathione S-transferase